MNRDDISLYVFARLLFRHWKWVALGTVIAALTTYIVVKFRTPMYAAESTVVMLRSRTDVTLDPRIETLDDSQLGRSDLDARRSSLIALVSSNEVVNRVLADVEEHLQPEESNAESLRRMIETESAGDLINLNVSYSEPETAALIANSWVENYESYVNQIYGIRTNVTNSNISEQISDTRQKYDESQADLVKLIAEDPTATLQREIRSRQELLDSYEQLLVDVQVNPVSAEQALLQSYYAELQGIETALADATALREQVASDTGSAASNMGNSLALILLRSRIFSGQRLVAGSVNQENSTELGTFSSTLGSPTILQLDLSSLPAEGIQTGDVDALIQVLNQRREATQERIVSLVRDINSGQTVQTPVEPTVLGQISELEKEIASLQGEIESFTAQRRELTEARDRNWETYQLLLGKQVEEQIASASPAAEVRIADTALPPVRPVSRGLITKTLLAGLVGATVSAAIVLFWAWWSLAGIVVPDQENSGLESESAREEESGNDQVQPRGVPEQLPS